MLAVLKRALSFFAKAWF